MPSAGPNSPSSVTSVSVTFSETVDWTDPANAATSDTNYATVDLGPGDTSYALWFTDFDFTNSDVPLGATIVGALFEVQVSQTGAGADAAVISRASLVYDGSELSSFLDNLGFNAGNFPFTPDGTGSYWPLGDPTDTGGASVTQSMVVDASFGVGIKFSGGSNSSIVSVDHGQLTIYYTVSGVVEGDATISGTATVTATAALVKTGGVSGTGSATAAGAAGSTKIGSASVSGVAAAAGVGSLILGGAASFAGSAFLAAIAASFAGAAATVSGAAAATSVGASIAMGAASAAGSCTAAAASALVVAAAGALDGTSALAVISGKIAAGDAAAGGSASLSAAGASIAIGAVTAAGIVTVLGVGGIHLATPTVRTINVRGTVRSFAVRGGNRSFDAGRDA